MCMAKALFSHTNGLACFGGLDVCYVILEDCVIELLFA